MDMTLRIQRYDPEKDLEPYFGDFDLQTVSSTDTVLDLLNRVKWEVDGSLTYRRSCMHGICGSDALKINGRNRLACSVLVQDLKLKKNLIQVEPIPALPLEKDLVVDMSSFFDKYKIVKPYLIPKDAPPERERYQSNEDAELLFESAKCIHCGSCSTSCPSLWVNENYIGPAVFLKAYRFIFDSRDDATAERLDLIDTPDGLWRCHTIFNCVEACPKEIDITGHISQLKKAALRREI
ncbi:MAG: succinate dehydrogenase iron-sulfur subunit [Candidatus Marinimicrobia bacterium]|nr:succinate dehydrogenase iron-sulfur subunit [Candidatus Neomarinimicrobiota bacterium]MCH7619336.1 succinate dehydrogenase iron-sulfur subunit [Candidatus Neomarinimicrobiota bacterium]